MDSRSRAAFGLLIVAQAAHSVEEYAFRLFDVFGPARFVSGLFSDNIARGFAVANIGIAFVGVWCYVARVRTPHPSERAYAWSWTCSNSATASVISSCLACVAGTSLEPARRRCSSLPRPTLVRGS